MQSFQWKKKPNKTRPQKLSLFEEEPEDDHNLDPTVDWLTAAKRPKLLLLEDHITKAKRLCEEGITLAEEERWWEAINRWIGALTLTPKDFKVQDMIAQAYLKVGEVYPAVCSATKATEIAPHWWPGHQTLGRAQLAVGEVGMAIKSFSRAIHIAPNETELWKDDLEWAVSLRMKEEELKAEELEKRRKYEEENSIIIEEITDCEATPLTDDKGEHEDPCQSSRNAVPLDDQKIDIANKGPVSTSSMVRYRS